MRPDTSALGIEPLDTRSIVLSALLGNHPPALPVRALVALAELFGVRPGTVRTALSRMVAAGELTTDDGWYQLAGRLLDRQREQDSGRVATTNQWDGTWWNVTVEPDRRDVAERRAFRAALSSARFGELRPDIWLRPANTPGPPELPGVIVTHGTISADDVGALVSRLWPLAALEDRAARIVEALHEQHDRIERGHDADLPDAFTVAAAAVRFLRAEPQLPSALAPDTWTAPHLRSVHDEFTRAFDRRLRAFFAR